MAGGETSNHVGDRKYFPGKITVHVFLACLMAATCGLIFGYDIGISGGVTSMDSFLIKFFPTVYSKEKGETSTNQYCRFDSQVLTMFTSSLYLAALITSFFASAITRARGRKWSMFIGGAIFLAGAVLNASAMNLAMLIIGRILLGIGVGFTTQSAPVYIVEMAPAKIRGMLNNGFQLMITVGILAANLVNYGTAKIRGGWGWRISLGLAAIPAAIITAGSLFLPDTPSSLIERGHEDEARAILSQIRGNDDIQKEFNEIKAAGEESKRVKNPWGRIAQRQHRPQLMMAILIPFFEQLTGINVIMFYAPVLFKTIGFKGNASLMSAVIIGLVNVLATFVAIFTVDRAGRRLLLLQGGLQMLACLVTIGTLIAVMFGISGEGDIARPYAFTVVVFICIYVAGFAWSWGPVGLLVVSESFPLVIRSAGLSIAVSVSMLFSFAIAQAFLALLCRLKFGLFYFFGGWVLIMTVFVAFFVPETKGVPIEEMVVIWKAHWFWGRFISDNDVHLGGMSEMGHGKDSDAARRRL